MGEEEETTQSLNLPGRIQTKTESCKNSTNSHVEVFTPDTTLAIVLTALKPSAFKSIAASLEPPPRGGRGLRKKTEWVTACITDGNSGD